MQDSLDAKIETVISNANKEAIARQNAITDAAEVIAEYLSAWGRHEEQGRTAWATSVPKGFLEDIEHAAEDRLSEIWGEAAKEQALNWKADALGMWY